MTSSRVYVVQDDGRFDLSDARRYGELHVLFKKDVFPDDAAEKMPLAVSRAMAELCIFNPETDYLCLVGSPLYTAVCALVLGRMGTRNLRMLRYDRIEGQYYVVEACL